eukprot:gene291-346_t
MTKAMAIEWGPNAIRVNTLCPTFIRTPLAEQTLAIPERRAWILSKIKLGRVGEVEDLMGPIVWRLDGRVRMTLEKTTEKVTSAEVARLAGVSQSAVSRVFTPGASVSAKTMEKVRAAAEELGYRPNVLARSLITGRTRIIGLVVAYLENQFYPMALELLSRALQARGYHILVFMAENSTERVAQVMSELLDYQVDGIITASVAMSNDLTTRCDGAGIPVVMFN